MATKVLTHLAQTTQEFSTSLGDAMKLVPTLHPSQHDGMHTHLVRIQMQLNSAVSTLAALKAKHQQASQPQH